MSRTCCVMGSPEAANFSLHAKSKSDSGVELCCVAVSF